MSQDPKETSAEGLKNLSNSAEFNYYTLPRSPIERVLKKALENCGIKLHEWSSHLVTRNAVWVGDYSELRELLIQASPGDLVLILADSMDEVELAFAEGADDVLLLPVGKDKILLFEARWMRRNSGYDLTALLETDAEGVVLHWNRAFLLLTGFSPDELRGKVLSDLFEHMSLSVISDFMHRAEAQSASRPENWILRTAEGKSCEVLLSVKSIKRGDRKLMEFVMLDLNNRRQSRTYRTTQLLNDIAKSSPIIMTIYDLRLKRNIYQSRSLFISLGYSNQDIEEALQGKGSRNQFFHDEYVNAIDHYYEQITSLKDGEKKELIYRVRHKSGSWEWIRKISSVFYRDHEGIPTQVLNSFENITEQRENESRIFESEARNRALIDAIPDHIFRISQAGSILDFKVNSSESSIINFKSRSKVPLEHLKEFSLSQLLPPDYLSTLEHAIRETLESGERKKVEFDFNIEGSLRSFEITVARSSIDEVIVVIHEVTDSKIKEKLIQDRLNFVEQIGDISSRLIGVAIDQIDDSITDALEFVAKYTSVDRAYIYELEESGTVVRLSYEWAREDIRPISSVIPRVDIAQFDAYRDKMEKGTRIVSTIDPEVLKNYNPAIQNLINSLETKSFANLPLIEDGRAFGFAGFDSVRKKRRWSDEELEIYAFTARLIANALLRKETENKLIQSRERAIEASHAKESFLSTMSHEIRTPLNAIVGMTHLLGESDLSDKQLDMLRVVRFSSDNLLNLINDILDFSKIESGKIHVEENNFSLHEILHGMKESFRQKAEEKGLNLEINIDQGVPEALIGDVNILLQILGNLVSNAIKFTQEGSVSVNVETQGMMQNKHVLRFTVQDTGIGVAAEKHHEIFERFVQEDSSTTRNYGGTGLGLAIVRSLLLHMGSEISLESEKNKGATFSFDLPFKLGVLDESEDSGVAVDESKNITGKSILLVEDNILNQKVAERFLLNQDLKVTIAENGEMALLELGKSTFDLVLMDLQMPVMDGLEAAKRIRASKFSWKDIPIVALTANASNSVEASVRDAGMNDFVTKPFQPEKLNAILRKWIQ